MNWNSTRKEKWKGKGLLLQRKDGDVSSGNAAQKEGASFFISLFVRVPLSELICLIYAEENNDQNHPWEQQSVNHLFGAFPLGRPLEHKEELQIKQVLSTNDKCSLFPVPPRF